MKTKLTKFKRYSYNDSATCEEFAEMMMYDLRCKKPYYIIIQGHVIENKYPRRLVIAAVNYCNHNQITI